MNQISILALLFISVIITVSGCGGSSSSSSGGNTAPVADAGTDRNVITGALVNLNGNGSSDADGDNLSYQWTLLSQPASSASSLANATTVSPSFTPLVNGDYVISLVVNDGTVDSSVDTVTITAAPTANNLPIAVAAVVGNDEVVTASTVTLDGSGSFDADGDTLTYQWSMQSQPVGSSATLLGSDTQTPSFTPIVDGDYSISLIVNDGTEDSSPDNVSVMAASAAFYAGRTKYDNDCASCHAAGTHDTSTNQGGNDLYGQSGMLRTDISFYSPSRKSGVADLTAQEITDLTAFLDSPLIEP